MGAWVTYLTTPNDKLYLNRGAISHIDFNSIEDGDKSNLKQALIENWNNKKLTNEYNFTHNEKSAVVEKLLRTLGCQKQCPFCRQCCDLGDVPHDKC